MNLACITHPHLIGLGPTGRGTYRIAGTEQATVACHLASCFRHLLEFQIDPEATEEGSGLSVLDHAMAQLAIVVDLVEDPPQ